MAKRKTPSAMTFFILGSVCVAGLLSEYLVIIAEQFIYDKTYLKFTITESITHWVIICVLWGFLGLVLFYISARVYDFDFTKKKRLPSVKGFVISILLTGTSVGLKHRVFSDWKAVIDFRNSGWFQFIFQYVYYLFVLFLSLIMIVFVQEAFDRVLKKETSAIPFGGIVLSMVWGFLHFVTEFNPASALCYAAAALLIGAEYLASNKNIYIAYGFSVLIFLI